MKKQKKEPVTFTIPATIDEAVGALDGIERLLVAKGWERAAIVAAFVRPEPSGGRPSTKAPKNGDFLNVEQFAKLGIAGLTKPDTVRTYVQRWLAVHDGIHPEPGAEVIVPDDDWPPTRTGTDGYESDEGAKRAIAKIAEKNPAALADAVKALAKQNPEAVADAIHDAGVLAEAEVVDGIRARRQGNPTPTADRKAAEANASEVRDTLLKPMEDAKVQIGVLALAPVLRELAEDLREALVHDAVDAEAWADLKDAHGDWMLAMAEADLRLS